MKLLFSFITFLLVVSSISAQTYTAASYNIRYDTENDGVNRWDNRKQWLVNQVKEFSPDILGTQEGLKHQIAYLDSALENFAFTGVGRSDGDTAGEYAAIFYNTGKLDLIEEGTFWLSDTPSQVSVGWDAALPRVCTYALLNDPETGFKFWVFNAHLDHVGEQSRLESLKLIWEKATRLNKSNHPLLLMGDLNAVLGSKPIQFITGKLQDTRASAKQIPTGPIGTFNGFDTSTPLDRRIDYIFANDKVEVYTYRVLNEVRQNRTPSDHLPVVITFSAISSDSK